MVETDSVPVVGKSQYKASKWLIILLVSGRRILARVACAWNEGVSVVIVKIRIEVRRKDASWLIDGISGFALQPCICEDS